MNPFYSQDFIISFLKKMVWLIIFAVSFTCLKCYQQTSSFSIGVTVRAAGSAQFQVNSIITFGGNLIDSLIDSVKDRQQYTILTTGDYKIVLRETINCELNSFGKKGDLLYVTSLG